MINLKKVILGTIVGLTILVSNVSAVGGYTLLDSIDVADKAGAAFIMIGVAFIVIVAVVIIKILSDL